MRSRHVASMLAALLMLSSACTVFAAEMASATDCGHKVVCDIHEGDASVTLTEQQQAALKQGKDPFTGGTPTKSYEYRSVVACWDNSPENPSDVLCMGAVQGCKGNTPKEGLGPLMRVYRREVDATGNPVGTGVWDLIGTSCNPQVVPGKPVLGMAQVLNAFHLTPFAKPEVHVQPEGNVTLVTLPTYFQVTWPSTGFQPGEIDTVGPAQMLGHTVRIRPIAKSYTYVFGDGTSDGPTDSAGGPYPTGDIIKTYDKAGSYATQIRITYGGEFSVDGGEWIEIPDTVDISGPTQAIQVKTAKNRLYSH